MYPLAFISNAKAIPLHETKISNDRTIPTVALISSHFSKHAETLV
jgi:hypothetical protein